MKANTATIWVCVDCVLMHANGEATESPDREPLNLISDDDEISLGLTLEEHDSSCTEELRESGECGCDMQDFSWRPCEGCGSTLGGSRHALTLWFD